MITLDCRRCRRWQLCPGKEWYSYAEIRWCPHQCLWALANRRTLESGRWVEKPERVEVGARGKGQKPGEGYFVKAVVILGEVMARLQTTGEDGAGLLKEVDQGRDITTLSRAAFEVLRYISGYRRKKLAYGAWRWQRGKRERVPGES